MTVHDNNGYNTNIEKAIDAVKTYSKAVGVNCMLLSMDGHTLFYSCDIGCSFCENVGKNPKLQEKCRSAHLYGSYQAERFGGKYVFFCPLGLVHWASPIIVDGIMQASLLAGPVHMVEPEEFMVEDILNRHAPDINTPDNMHDFLYDIEVIKPDRVNALSELMFLVTEHLSGKDTSRFDEDRELLSQQSDIAGYIQHIKTMGGDDSSLDEYPMEKEKELLALISIGDKAGSQRILNEILGHIFFSTGRNFEVIKARTLEMIVLLSRAALEGGADVEQIFGLNYKYINQINDFNTAEELSFWLSKIMMRFTDLVFNLKDVKHVDVIYKSIDFIKRNYMHKLSLEGVAAHVYLSPSYFSKIFKEEMKCNFSRYLNIVRIEKSKSLLVDVSVALVDISNMVGYEDQSYFSKVFKKIVGVSPGKYRESRGQLALNDL